MAATTRVAAVQMCAGIQPDTNIEALRRLVAEAAGKGAEYVLTPEVSVAFAGDRQQLAEVAGPFANNPAVAAIGEMAAAHRIHVHLGSLAVRLDDGHFANRSVLFGPDGVILATYDKIHLFDADPPDDRPYRESETYHGGGEAVVADGPGFRLGLSICFDVRFPRLYAALAEAGAEVLAVPAAFTVPTGKAHWEVLLRARAIETGSFVVAAAQGGAHENGRATWGHSMIVDPWGEVLAERAGDTPGVVVADIDTARVADVRARVPALANTCAFSLSVNRILS